MPCITSIGKLLSGKEATREERKIQRIVKNIIFGYRFHFKGKHFHPKSWNETKKQNETYHNMLFSIYKSILIQLCLLVFHL